MPSARARRPIDYFRNARQFGHTPAGGPQAGLPLQWPTGGAARDLRGAVLQHCIVVATRDALSRHPRRPSLATIATGGRVDLSHLRMAMRGEAYMQMPEAATLASVAPNALPDPAWVHSMVTSATVGFGQRIRASRSGVPGVLGALSVDQIAEEEVMAALQGWVAVEPLPGDAEADDRLAAAAGPLLNPSAREQARAVGLPIDATRRQDSTVIRATNAYAPAGVDGCYDPAGPVLVAHLPDDWTETVHDEGWAVIDGHFIVEITGTRNGRPHTVRAVRLYSEAPEDVRGEWLYSADLAGVIGPEGRPTLAFRDPPRLPMSSGNVPDPCHPAAVAGGGVLVAVAVRGKTWLPRRALSGDPASDWRGDLRIRSLRELVGDGAPSARFRPADGAARDGSALSCREPPRASGLPGHQNTAAQGRWRRSSAPMDRAATA